MSIYDLKAAFDATTPGEWYECDTCSHQGCIAQEQSGVSIAVTYDKRDTRFIALAHNDMAALLEAVELLRTGGELVVDAMENHIYNPDNGEVPGPTCEYQAHVDAVRNLLEKLR